MKKKHTAGFTLIEMLVSLALFSIVVLVAIGALLSLIGANKKAQALESVMDNLNITIDDMVRNARQGTDFNGQLTLNNGLPTCGSNPGGGANDCTGGGTAFEFEPYGGVPTNNDQWVFEFVCPVAETTVDGLPYCPSGGYIAESQTGPSGTFTQVTAPEVSITSMTFYVVGQEGSIQPKVVIIIEGTAGAGDVQASTTFHIEATAVQRVLDL